MINFLLSSVIQLTQPTYPAAPMLCIQQVVKVNNQYKLDTTTFFLNQPTQVAEDGVLVGAQTSDRINLTQQQVVKTNELHSNGVCATPTLLIK